MKRTTRAPRSLPRLLLLAAALATPPTTAQTNWQDLQPATSPVPLSDVIMAYDSVRDRLVLFGGWDGTKDLEDTWEFDGADWAKVTTTTNPGPHSTHGMVFDAARKNTLMFGGYCSTACAKDTTWTFDGKDWLQHNPATSPSARMSFGMAYDSDRQRVVLFGGFCGTTNCIFTDTWEWDGTTWSIIQTATSPGARFGARMVYDSQNQRMVLYGGRDQSQRLQDTWVFDGTDWQQVVTPTAPGIRVSHGMEFDSWRRRVVLFGGFNGSVHTNQTWEFDGSIWAQRTTASAPSPRSFFATAFDTKRGRTLVFGGATRSPLGGTYAYASDHPARYTPFGSGCAGSAGIPSLGANGSSLPWIGEDMEVVLGNLATSAQTAVFGLGGSATAWGSMRLPLDLGPWGGRGCHVLAAFDIGSVETVQGGRATWRFAIPVSASLLGAQFFNQAYAPDTTNALGIVMSNGCVGTIGSL